MWTLCKGDFPAIWKFYSIGIYSEHQHKTTDCKSIILSMYTTELTGSKYWALS